MRGCTRSLTRFVEKGCTGKNAAQDQHGFSSGFCLKKTCSNNLLPGYFTRFMQRQTFESAVSHPRWCRTDLVGTCRSAVLGKSQRAADLDLGDTAGFETGDTDVRRLTGCDKPGNAERRGATCGPGNQPA